MIEPGPTPAETVDQAEIDEAVKVANEGLGKFWDFDSAFDAIDKSDKSALMTLQREIETYATKLAAAEATLDKARAQLTRSQKTVLDASTRMLDKSADSGFYGLLGDIAAEIGDVETVKKDEVNAFITELRDGNADLTTPEGQAKLADVLEFLLAGRGAAAESAAATTKKAKEAKAPKEREPQYHTKPFLLRNINKVFAQHGVAALGTIIGALTRHDELDFAKEANIRIAERQAFNNFMREANRERTIGLKFNNAEGFAVVYNKALKGEVLSYSERVSLGAIIKLAQELDQLDTGLDLKKLIPEADIDDVEAMAVRLRKILETDDDWMQNDKKKDALKGFFKLCQLHKLFESNVPQVTMPQVGVRSDGVSQVTTWRRRHIEPVVPPVVAPSAAPTPTTPDTTAPGTPTVSVNKTPAEPSIPAADESLDDILGGI